MTFPLPKSDEGLEIILKVVGETCNLNCHYCYERRKPYARRQVLEPDAVAAFLKRFGERPLSIGIHGGEPLLLGRDRLAEIFRVIDAYPGRKHVNIQTNGTLIDREWIRFFKTQRMRVRVGLSVDGPEAANIHRVSQNNSPTAHSMQCALELLSAERLEVGIISVVTSASLGFEAEILQYFASYSSVRALKFAPCFDFDVKSKDYRSKSGVDIIRQNPTGNGLPQWAVTPMEYTSFLCAAFDFWCEHKLFLRFTLEPLTSFIRAILGRDTESCHFSDKKCAFVLTLYPDGTVGSCDELPMPAATLSSRGSEPDVAGLLAAPKNMRKQFDEVLQRCASCDYQRTCGGGCLATRVRYLGTTLYDEYCDHRKGIIDHVRECMVESDVGVVDPQ